MDDDEINMDRLNYYLKNQHNSNFIKHAFNSPQFKKHIIQRLMCMGVIFLVWVYFNGGILPFFLRQKIPMFKIGSEASVLMYFPHSEDDGVNIRWAHAVNNLDQLERALDSHDIEMIEADVMLRGQGTSQQSLVPVMAQLPDTDSQVTFDAWLDMVIKRSSKGIKLDFQAIDAVEITLQKLKERKEQISFPVWLHADVLPGPWGGAPRVDAVRFTRIVKRLFPACTLSLGWTTGTHTDLSQTAYTWDNVLDMYYLVDKLELEIPVVYSVRVAFVANSVPQIKWLVDNTKKGSVLVWRSDRDLNSDIQDNLMYMCYRFPPHNTFFDFQDAPLYKFLLENRHTSREKLDPLVKMRDTIVFRPEAWLKMGFYIEPHTILPSTEAVMLSSRAVYLVSKAKYKPTENLRLQGRVQFLNRKDLQEEEGRTGLNIFVRSTSYVDYERIVGIRCFIGIDGVISVSSSNLPGKEFREQQRMTRGSMDCFRFSVVDAGNKIIFTVSVEHDCFTLNSAKRSDRVSAVLTATIPNIGDPDDEHPFIVKLDDSKRTAILDELTIKYH